MEGATWPDQGEIDVFENVNLATNNRYTLHTTDGCMHPDNSSSSSIETGTVISTDCYNAYVIGSKIVLAHADKITRTDGNEGCIVQDPSTNSYGEGFANNGGGVFAMLWNADGIRTWFFERSSIPSDLENESPDPESWTTPTAYWPASDCDPSKFFGPQTLTFVSPFTAHISTSDEYPWPCRISPSAAVTQVIPQSSLRRAPERAQIWFRRPRTMTMHTLRSITFVYSPGESRAIIIINRPRPHVFPFSPAQ